MEIGIVLISRLNSAARTLKTVCLPSSCQPPEYYVETCTSFYVFSSVVYYPNTGCLAGIGMVPALAGWYIRLVFFVL